MIRDMEDLFKKMKSDANEYQSDLKKKRFAIYDQGIDNTVLENLKKQYHLPQSYLDCLLKYNVFRVCIGYFSISPISYDVDNIIDSLLLAQKESFLPHNIIDPLDLYWVGNNNNDTIYVAGKNSAHWDFLGYRNEGE